MPASRDSAHARQPESSSRNLRPKRDALSPRGPKRKPYPRFRAQTGIRFPLATSTGNRVPESALETGRTFRSCYSSAWVQATSLKPGIAKSSPTSSGHLTSMPSVANSS